MAKRKSKKEIDSAKELAYILYLNGTPNIEISERIGISVQTISGWVTDGNWKEKRAAKTVTRTELVNRTLEQINTMLSADRQLSPADADKLVKLAALIERLDKKNSPVIAMEIFIQFVSFLQSNVGFDKELDIDFIKKVNKYQDSYVTSIMNA